MKYVMARFFWGWRIFVLLGGSLVIRGRGQLCASHVLAGLDVKSCRQSSDVPCPALCMEAPFLPSLGSHNPTCRVIPQPFSGYSILGLGL